MAQPVIYIDGKVVQFAHLAPITRKVCLELRGGHRKEVAVEFNFSCHCYSRGLENGEVAPIGLEVPDGSVHMPRPRVFDFERYAMSLSLVALIDQMIATNATVTKTRQENFFRVDQMETTRTGAKISVAYFVFFHARKIQVPNRPNSLLVFVESAYAEQNGIPHPAGKGSRSLGEMLGEKW